MTFDLNSIIMGKINGLLKDGVLSLYDEGGSIIFKKKLKTKQFE